MTPRERWLALFNREKPDRVPTDYWATEEVSKRLLKDLGCPNRDALFAQLHIDGVDHIGARRTVRQHPDDPEANIWGVRRKRVEYGTGTYDEAVYHPLEKLQTVDEVHAFTWPDPDDFDWEHFKQQVKGISGRRVVRCGGYEPYLLYCSLRGMEQSLMDLLDDEEIADAILGYIFDYHYRVNARMFEMAKDKIDITYIAEDLGMQNDLLMNLDLIRRFILPNQKKMADLARSFGIHIFYHTDGAARKVIPDLIDVTGIEVLNPIQWRCPGMDREGLVRDFGDKVIFHGAVDNQQTLAFGSPDEVHREVLDNLRIFSWPTRYICAPCHNLQAVSPTVNIVAMYETLWEYGKL